MRVVALWSLVIACGPQPQPQPQPPPRPRACHEGYDDASAERASTERARAAEALLGNARAGDHAALTRSLAPGNTADPGELAALLVTIPASCELVWYAQPGRFAIQPALVDEPADPVQEALAEAIDAADHVVATCDGGCAVLALALQPTDGAVVAWMPITQRPGNAH